ncbi:hypothetical protein EDC01DRAFT_781422 [Geopyxis carbonaria]|nr:hypothetical protein EDC01DRAFT_781422 [Geopyxis carbonaria]
MTSAAPASKPGKTPAQTWTPGGRISPSTCNNNYKTHSCPARLPSRNVLATARHVVVSKSGTHADGAAGGFTAGWTDAGAEVRAYAMIRDFPGGGPRGQRCRLHFITDGDSKLLGRNQVDHWHAYETPYSRAESLTWGSAPRQGSLPVATFITDTSMATMCPTADAAWVVAPGGKKGSGEMVVDRYNGLAVEILSTAQYSGWGVPDMKKGENHS